MMGKFILASLKVLEGNALCIIISKCYILTHIHTYLSIDTYTNKYSTYIHIHLKNKSQQNIKYKTHSEA